MARRCALFKAPGYHPYKDFTPISLMFDYQLMVVVHPSFKVSSHAELVAAEAMIAGMFDAWRDGSTAMVPLMLELKPLRVGLAPLRLEHVPVANRLP